LIQDKLHAEGCNKELGTIIKMLQNREAELRKSKSISSDVLLYIKATTKKTTAKGKSDTKKDKEKRVCTHCKKEGHLEEKYWEKHGPPERKQDKKKKYKEDSKDKDKKGATANFTITDTLWMANDDDVDSGSDPSRDVFLDCACSRHVMNTKTFFTKYLSLREGAHEASGFDGFVAYAEGVRSVRLPMRIPPGRAAEGTECGVR
jgi:hypothetical protein